jgi:hypothetical protein
MPPLAAAHFLASHDAPPGVALPSKIGHVGAPVDRRHDPYPVVLYSPGGSSDAALGTGLVEDLVSHGYVVVAMDDTNESPEVEFPGGRLVVGAIDPTTVVTDERAYIRAFFDTYLRHRDGHLLDGPSPRHPDINLNLCPNGIRRARRRRRPRPLSRWRRAGSCS